MLSPLGTWTTIRPTVPAPGDTDVYGAFGEMRIGRVNRSTRRKPVPVTLRPPSTRDRSRDAAVTNCLSYGVA
jgi:hypothetical protein